MRQALRWIVVSAVATIWIGCNGAISPAQWVPDSGVLIPEGDASPPQDREICGNGLDDDGDGQVDEGCRCTVSEQSCYPGPANSLDVGICRAGTQQCQDRDEFSFWGECLDAVTPKNEICGDGLDNNCDGVVDESCETGGDAGNGGSDAGNGGSDAGNGGSDAGNGGSDAGTPPACGPATCASGCCDAQGQCQVSAFDSCGVGGGRCQQCGANEICQAGQCKRSSCGPAFCPTGCCDDTGKCQVPKAATCGFGGSRCMACQQGQACQGGQCIVPPVTTYRVVALFGRVDHDICRKQFIDHDHCDIYLKVWLGNKYGKTGYDGDTGNPRWNDLLFTATDRDLLATKLKVELWDADSLGWGTDDRVSTCYLTITAAHLSAGRITTRCDKADSITIGFHK